MSHCVVLIWETKTVVLLKRVQCLQTFGVIPGELIRRRAAHAHSLLRVNVWCSRRGDSPAADSALCLEPHLVQLKSSTGIWLPGKAGTPYTSSGLGHRHENAPNCMDGIFTLVLRVFLDYGSWKKVKGVCGAEALIGPSGRLRESVPSGQTQIFTRSGFTKAIPWENV